MRPRMSRAFVAGFMGTVFITLSMYFVSPFITGGPTDIAAMLGSMLGGSWIAGMIGHFVIGTLVLPALYVLFVYQRLGGSPALRGVLWGLSLWLFAQAVVVPVTGGGFFSAQAGGLRAVMGSLVGHLVYGIVFGVLAGGSREAISRGEPAFESPMQARRAS